MERGPIVGRLFLNHGEDSSRQALRDLLVQRGLDRDTIVVPAFDESFELTAETAQSKGRAAQRIDDSALERDWYNDYAAFILQLADKLESTREAGQRRQLVARLRDALEA